MEVIISLPFALFKTAPPKYPKTIAIGVPTSIAKKSPGAPVTPQSVISISPICPAIAPKTIPKLIPMPAIIGSKSAKTKNKFLPRRVTISLARNVPVYPESGIATTLMIKNKSGTALPVNNFFNFLLSSFMFLPRFPGKSIHYHTI